MRPRSILGPIVLILIGVLFLMRNLIPDIPLFDLFVRYWPFLLIIWGGVRLLEVLIWFARSKPLPPAGVSGGEWTFVVVICIVGSMLYWGSEFYRTRWPGTRITSRGLEIFGETHEFPVSVERNAVGATPRVVVQLGRGNARIVGADVDAIRVTGRKSIRAFEEAEAAKSDRATPIEIVPMGGQILVRTNQEMVDRSQSITNDLEITVPKGASVEGQGRYGDFDINDLTGSVEIVSDNAGVRVQNIGGNVKVDLKRSDIVRATNVKGTVDIRGKSGQDVEVESTGGSVTVSGAFSGQLNFRKIPAALRFDSRETEFRVEKVPGSVAIDLGQITAEDVQGPIRLNTRTRDLHFREFSNSLDVSVQRGDIELRPAKAQMGRIDAKTANGDIDVVFPAGAQFNVAATTKRGEVHNEFGSALREEARENRGVELKGSIGSGPQVTLTTDRGAVSLRKGGESRNILPQTLTPPGRPAAPPAVPPVPKVVEQ